MALDKFGMKLPVIIPCSMFYQSAYIQFRISALTRLVLIVIIILILILRNIRVFSCLPKFNSNIFTMFRTRASQQVSESQICKNNVVPDVMSALQVTII